jgi:hypothetical protein
VFLFCCWGWKKDHEIISLQVRGPRDWVRLQEKPLSFKSRHTVITPNASKTARLFSFKSREPRNWVVHKRDYSYSSPDTKSSD